MLSIQKCNVTNHGFAPIEYRSDDITKKQNRTKQNKTKNKQTKETKIKQNKTKQNKTK